MEDAEACAPAMHIYGVGNIGGIESITLNGIRYYFGFNPSSDSLTSPLFSEIDAMAAFASRYMEQRDGSHDPSYWRALAEESIGSSELSDEEGSRDFSTGRMQRISTALRQAQTDNTPIPGFEIEYHLLSLLEAAGGDCNPFEDATLANALSRFHLNPREYGLPWIEEMIAILNQSRPLPSDASYSDAALVIQRYLDSCVHNSPDNWKALFLPITSTFRFR